MAGDLLATVRLSLEDGKAVDIVEIAVGGISSVADYFVIAEGSSVRHVGSLADNLLQAVKDGHGVAGFMEGEDSCDWVVVDFGDIVVHLFRPEVRAFYDLEGLWGGLG